MRKIVLVLAVILSGCDSQPVDQQSYVPSEPQQVIVPQQSDGGVSPLIAGMAGYAIGRMGNNSTTYHREAQVYHRPASPPYVAPSGPVRNTFKSSNSYTRPSYNAPKSYSPSKSSGYTRPSFGRK